MKLHFVTSISKNYWNSTAKYCIPTWNLPGDVTVFVDQSGGDLDWVAEVPFHKELLHVPVLTTRSAERSKVRKFWGKASAQIEAIRNRGVDERIIWIDADVEQTGVITADMFDFEFSEPLAMMYSGDNEDCWETGVVIFNQRFGKINIVIRQYERIWNDEDELMALFRPYDAQVLGNVAESRTYLNLCNSPCKNIDALKNTRFNGLLTHWINKDNKKKLQELKDGSKSSDIPQVNS